MDQYIKTILRRVFSMTFLGIMSIFRVIRKKKNMRISYEKNRTILLNLYHINRNKYEILRSTLFVGLQRV